MAHEIKSPYFLITASVPKEAKGIKDHLTSMKQSKIGGRPVFKGVIGDVSIRLVETGPGMVNTVQSLTAVIEAEPPDLILMTGCAGGFEAAGVNVGDIGIATEENDAHLGIEAEQEGNPPEPLPFDLEVIDGVPVSHRIPVDRRLSDRATAILEDASRNKQVNLVSGPFVTVSTVTATDRRAGRLFKRFHPCMESMEGSAGAHVALHYRIPFLEIRCASNLVGKRNRDAWDLPLACRRSSEAVVVWIKAQKTEK